MSLFAGLKPLARRGAILIALLLLAAAGHALSLRLAALDALNWGKTDRRSLLNLLRIDAELSDASSPSAMFNALINADVKYPPLLYMLALPLRRVLPVHDDRMAALWVMFLFFIALDCGIFLLLRSRLSPSRALLGAALVGLAPGVLNWAAIFSPDFPCMAVLCLAVGLSANTAVFRRWGPTAALAAVCGAGMMLYYSMPVFLAGPVCYALIAALAQSTGRRRVVLGRLALFAAIVAAISAPYYLAQFAWSWVAGRSETFTTAEGLSAGTEYALLPRAALWFFRYIWELFKELWQGVVPLALLIAVVGWRALWPRRARDRLRWRPSRAAGLVLAALSIALLFFSFFGHKNVNYVIPLMPLPAYPFCLALAGGFFEKRSWLALLLVSVCVLVGALSSFADKPRFSQQMVDRVVAPIRQQCRHGDPPCLVLMHYCDVPTCNVLLVQNQGWDAQRMLIKNPPPPEQGGPPAESVDFILLELKDNRLTTPQLSPGYPQCAASADVDPQTGEVRSLSYHNRDVTALFEQRARADGTRKSLILFGRAPEVPVDRPETER